jgi:hypothetical protein
MLLRRKLFLSGVVIFVLLCFSLVVSVDAASMWSQTYGGTKNDWAYSMVGTSDGGYAIAGYTESFGTGDDAWLVKTDALGNMQWNKTYNGTGYDGADSLVVTPDGGYALAGGGSGNSWLIKTDSNGVMEWHRTYGGNDVYSLIVTPDGGYAIAGFTMALGPGPGPDFWLMKTDEFGNMQWNKTYNGAGYESAYSLVTTSDGGYALAGHTWSYDAGNNDVWLVKTDAFGNMEWNQTYGGTGDDAAYSLVATSDGGYAIAGIWGCDSAGRRDFWLVKIDSLGNMEWNKTYGGEDHDEARSLVATSDGGYALAGYTGWNDTHPFHTGDFWLIKTDALGNMEWNRTYGGTMYDRALSLVATSDGGYAIAGYTLSFGAGGDDFWLVKTDENGVVPEYSSWLIPALVLTATTLIITNKKRLLQKRSRNP